MQLHISAKLENPVPTYMFGCSRVNLSTMQSFCGVKYILTRLYGNKCFMLIWGAITFNM